MRSKEQQASESSTYLVVKLLAHPGSVQWYFRFDEDDSTGVGVDTASTVLVFSSELSDEGGLGTDMAIGPLSFSRLI